MRLLFCPVLWNLPIMCDRKQFDWCCFRMVHANDRNFALPGCGDQRAPLGSYILVLPGGLSLSRCAGRSAAVITNGRLQAARHQPVSLYNINPSVHSYCR